MLRFGACPSHIPLNSTLLARTAAIASQLQAVLMGNDASVEFQKWRGFSVPAWQSLAPHGKIPAHFTQAVHRLSLPDIGCKPSIPWIAYMNGGRAETIEARSSLDAPLTDQNGLRYRRADANLCRPDAGAIEMMLSMGLALGAII